MHLKDPTGESSITYGFSLAQAQECLPYCDIYFFDKFLNVILYCINIRLAVNMVPRRNSKQIVNINITMNSSI